jgi:hypothetical protein
MRETEKSEPAGRLGIRTFRFGVEDGLEEEFLVLFQAGVFMEARSGTSVAGFMRDILGLAPDYIRTRVSTIFLNGKPVDDIEKAFLDEGSVLALSAAMPGLVGATLRSGGVLASMRGSISHRSEARTGSDSPCLVRVKLFNMILREAGPTLLQRGVIIEASRTHAVMDTLPAGSVVREDLNELPTDDTLILLVMESLNGHAG